MTSKMKGTPPWKRDLYDPLQKFKKKFTMIKIFGKPRNYVITVVFLFKWEQKKQKSRGGINLTPPHPR